MTSNTRENFTSEVGRLVWGSLTEPVLKDMDGKPYLDSEGKPAPRWQFGVAFEKHAVGQHFGTLIPPKIADSAGPAHGGWSLGSKLWTLATRLFPGGEYNSRDFSWKIVDGDSTEVSLKSKRKIPPCKREGFPGCWVVTFSSGFAPKCYNADGSAAIDPNAIKVGHYVQIAGTIDRNTGKSPGMYVNHGMVAHAGYGPEISIGLDASAVGFGQAPLPAGAQSAPIASFTPPPAASAAPAPVAPAAPAAYTPPAPTVAVPQVATPVPQTAVVPSQNFIAPPAVGAAPPPAAPAPPAPAPAPAAPAAPQMTAKAGNTPYHAFIQGGWTDATLRANGYMV